MNKGFILLHRTLLENPVVTKDSDYTAVWIYLLLSATHDDYEIDHLGKRFVLKRGQLVTGRNTIAEKYNVSPSKVQRILKRFEIEQQIEQQTSNKNRIITIINYDKYQTSEQQNEQQVNNKWTASEQQVNTNKEHKEHKEHKQHKQQKKEKDNNVTDNVTSRKPKTDIPYADIISYLNQKTNTSYKATSKASRDCIKARWNDGFRFDDFKTVIDKKTAEWLHDPVQCKYLRPLTLFGNKFEGYLNQLNNGTSQKNLKSITRKNGQVIDEKHPNWNMYAKKPENMSVEDWERKEDIV